MTNFQKKREGGIMFLPKKGKGSGAEEGGGVYLVTEGTANERGHRLHPF